MTERSLPSPGPLDPPPPITTPVAGIDGCRGAWMVVELDDDLARAGLVDDLTPLLARARSGELAAVGIDMPIGLLDAEARDCDVEARRLLGPRRSTVFPAPVRAVLGAADYHDACRRSRAASGKALSIQAFNLVPAIARLDRMLTPADQHRVVEAHPECALTRLAGRPPAASKHSPAGKAERIALLSGVHRGLARLLAERERSLPLVDVLDAAAVAITAARVAAGTERRMGHQRDRTGLIATIVY